MKKKLLISQNASLFAELERKAGEIKTLEIKLEDLNTEYNNAKEAFIQLEKSIEKLEEENAELRKNAEELKEQIILLKSIPAQVSAAKPYEAIDGAATQNAAELTEEKRAETPLTEQTEAPAVLDLKAGLSNENPEENEIIEDKPTPISKEDLKALGIKAIGEVTKAAALAMASVGEDESSYGKKSLIMGKNESFKFEILSILESASPDSGSKDKIDLLTKEALDHISNII